MRILLFTFLIGILPFFAHANEFETKAKQAIAIDFETGDVLFSKNADQRMPTSSMSKVITMAVVFDALKANELQLDSTLKVSEKAWRKQGSKMFVEVNKEVKVEDLIRGVIVQSGNDATIVLAEGISGSEDAFAQRLNDKAQELGMENSHFVNASGWPDDDHYSTASDLAKLGHALIKDYPEYYKYYSETEFEFNDIKQPNRNPLLYRNIGADGIKTGHTEAGGYGLIGAGERDGRRVIIVLNGLESSKDRASEAARLLDWALIKFENKKLFSAGEQVDDVLVRYGQVPKVSLTAGVDIFVTVPKRFKDDLQSEAQLDAPLVAPIEKGQKVGVLNIQVPGRADIAVPLVAAEAVAEKGFIGKALDQAVELLTGKAS